MKVTSKPCPMHPLVASTWTSAQKLTRQLEHVGLPTIAIESHWSLIGAAAIDTLPCDCIEHEELAHPKWQLLPAEIFWLISHKLMLLPTTGTGRGYRRSKMSSQVKNKSSKICVKTGKTSNKCLETQEQWLHDHEPWPKVIFFLRPSQGSFRVVRRAQKQVSNL